MQVEIASTGSVPAGFGGAGRLKVVRHKLFTPVGNVSVGVTEDRHAIDLHSFKIRQASNNLFLQRLFAVQAIKAEVVSGVSTIFDQVVPGHFPQVPCLEYRRGVLGRGRCSSERRTGFV